MLDATEARLLSVLSDNGELHGLEIKVRAEACARRSLRTGTLYKVLHRLEQMGCLRAHWEDAETATIEKRPRRRYYELTGEGERSLEEFLKQFGAVRLGGRIPAELGSQI